MIIRLIQVPGGVKHIALDAGSTVKEAAPTIHAHIDFSKINRVLKPISLHGYDEPIDFDYVLTDGDTLIFAVQPFSTPSPEVDPEIVKQALSRSIATANKFWAEFRAYALSN